MMLERSWLQDRGGRRSALAGRRAVFLWCSWGGSLAPQKSLYGQFRAVCGQRRRRCGGAQRLWQARDRAGASVCGSGACAKCGGCCLRTLSRCCAAALLTYRRCRLGDAAKSRQSRRWRLG